jgi:hypothetical protein
MRTALTAALLISMIAAPAARALDPTFLADFQGYDWTWPTADCLDCEDNYYEANGRIGSFNGALLTCGDEMTVTIGEDLFFSSADTFGTTVVAHYVNGQIKIVCDGSSASTYNRNGDCDPFSDRLTFSDGDVILSGQFTGFDLIYDTVSGNGNLQGLTDWTGGSQLGNVPPSQRSGWTFGAIGISTPQVPCGYKWQLDGECYLEKPVPVLKSTWGEIKAKANSNSITR